MATDIITTMTICNAIASTFHQVGGLTVQSYDQISDTVNQTPLLQVWWQAYEEDISSTGRTGTDRSASKRKVVQSSDIFIGRLIACQRTELKKDLKLTMELVEAMRDILYTEGPYFGLNSIRSVHHKAAYRDIVYPDKRSYVGARFEWNVRMF